LRLLKYNKPYYLIFIAVLCSACQGAVFPTYGFLYVKLLFSSLLIPVDHDMTEVQKWTYVLIGLGGFAFIVTYIYKSLFGYLGENMTLAMRKKLFKSIIHKHVGWFDLKENSTGQLVTTLA
jgi:ATP-binding cassette, subfamily B (MDR/TAP), member 1